jgi:hypothetical protein
MEPTNDIWEALPYLIVEEMDEGYDGSMNKESLKKPLDISRVFAIRKLHVMQFSEYGCYIGRNFGRNPHYQITADQYKNDIVRLCTSFHIPIRRYRPGDTVTSSSLIVCCNFTEGQTFESQETEDVHTALLNLNITEYDETSVTTGKNKRKGTKDNHDENEEDDVHEYPDRDDLTDRKDAIRGAKQRHFGYSSNYNLGRLEEKDGGYVTPRLVRKKVPEEWKLRFRSLTALGDAMYKHSASSRIRRTNKTHNRDRLYDDDTRNARFAKVIDELNRLEAFTHSETEFDPSPGTEFQGELIEVHADKNNDDTKRGGDGNYNCVLAAWKHFKKPNNVYKRVANLGYSRRSAGDFLEREQVCKEFIRKTMDPWLTKNDGWKTKVEPTSDIFGDEYFGAHLKTDATNGAAYFPPTINKQATFLSAFADSAMRLKGAFEKHNKTCLTMEKQIEIILPIIFCPCTVPYCTVIDSWLASQDKLSTLLRENMTSEYVLTATEKFESVRKGGLFRHQPSLNTEPTQRWIRESLIVMRDAVLRTRNKKKPYSFKCLMKLIKKIHGVGDLLGQHLVHVMVLTGLIAPKYGAEANVCMGTATAKKLWKSHGIKSSTFPCLLEYVCAYYGWLPYIAENAICKALLETNSRFVDCIFPTQETLRWVVCNSKGEYRLCVLKRPAVQHSLSEKDKNKKENRAHVLTLKLNRNSERKRTDVTVVSYNDAVRWWFVYVKETDLPVFVSPTTDTANTDVSTSFKKRKRKNDVITNKKARQSRGVGDETTMQESTGDEKPDNDFLKTHHVNWRLLDSLEMKKYSDRFSKELKVAAFHNRKESDFYSGGINGHTADLRIIHKMDKHFCSPRDNVQADVSFVTSNVKPSTHLISLGVGVHRVDLFEVTQRVVRDNFSEQNPRLAGMGTVLSVRVCPVLSKTKPGPVSFTAEAKLVSSEDTNVVLQTYSLHACHQRKLLLNGVTTGRAPDFVDSDGNGSKTMWIGYLSKEKARTTLLWHILTSDPSDGIWVERHIPQSKWRSIPTAGDNHNSTHPKVQYQILSLLNARGKAGKGEVLCTLVRFVGQSYYCKMEIFGSTQVRCIRRTDTLSDITMVSVCEDVPLLTTVSVHEDVPTTPNESIKATQDEDHNLMKIAIQTKKKPPSSPACVCAPLEIDPFTIFSLVTMEQSLTRWKSIWSDVLPLWKTSICIRQNKSHTDRFWHPPFTDVEKRLIRSKKDLYSFLNFSTKEVATGSHCNSQIDFVKLLTRWNTRQN